MRSLIDRIFRARPEEKEMQAFHAGAAAAETGLPIRIFPKRASLELRCETCLGVDGMPSRASGSPEPEDAMTHVRAWFMKHPHPEHRSTANYTPERRRGERRG